MKLEPIQIHVCVELGVSRELAALLNGLTGCTVLPSAKPEPEPEPQPQPEPQSKPKPQTKAKPQPEPEPAPESQPEPEPQPEPQPEPEPAPEPTVVDVRAAMADTRTRIEGPDWETNPDSEGRTRWHKRLSATFKRIAGLLGAEDDKPTKLPDGESRRRFIAECARLEIVNGELTKPEAF